jgi:hypothetical protein
MEGSSAMSRTHDVTISAFDLDRLERERDEWKAKYINQNKDLGCEMMDPAGTIWDYASGLQRENVQLKREIERERALANEAIATWKKTREERDEALSDLEFRRDLFKLQEQQLNDVRAERDRLAEALREIDVARLDDFMGPHDMLLKYVWIERESLAAVEGVQS